MAPSLPKEGPMASGPDFANYLDIGYFDIKMIDEETWELNHPIEYTVDFLDSAGADWRRLRGDPSSGATDLLRLLRLAALLERDLARLCAEQGLKSGQFQVLAALRRQDPAALSATDLARAAVLTSGAMTPVLDKLEAQGLIRRQADDEDRRARRITLTPKGRGQIDRALDLHLARLRDLAGAFEAEERDALSRSLRKLLPMVDL
jgi:DNA-binding MarR family transcriptional regulator